MNQYTSPQQCGDRTPMKCTGSVSLGGYVAGIVAVTYEDQDEERTDGNIEMARINIKPTFKRPDLSTIFSRVSMNTSERKCRAH